MVKKNSKLPRQRKRLTRKYVEIMYNRKGAHSLFPKRVLIIPIWGQKEGIDNICNV